VDNLFNKLSPDGDPSDSGMNTYELPNMPENQRRLMRIIMRKREISYQELLETIDNLPDEERLAPDQVDETLEDLNREGHIICVLEGQETTYKPNLRRKSGRNLMIKGLWDVLDSANEKVDSNEQRRKTGKMASALYGKLEDEKLKPATDQSDEKPSKPETF